MQTLINYMLSSIKNVTQSARYKCSPPSSIVKVGDSKKLNSIDTASDIFRVFSFLITCCCVEPPLILTLVSMVSLVLVYKHILIILPALGNI